ncbi:MAG: response regulator transcription factor [Bacteroidia bacterium]
MLIAIIEDNSSIRNNLVQLFELYDYKTITSENGLDGLNLIRKYKPSLVITDIMMPMMDGIKMVEQLREDKKYNHIPVIFLTAKNAEEDRIKGLETGAIDFISKPFATKELVQKVKNLIELGQTQIVNALSKPYEEEFESSAHKFLEKLRSIIDENLSSRNLDVYLIGKELNYSTSAIHKKIKIITNKSTNQFVREYRLEKAQQMIKSNHASISEIAFSTGFASVSYFSKSYKSYFGYNPTQSN